MIVITARQKTSKSEYGMELISVYKDTYTLKLTCTDDKPYEVVMTYEELENIDKTNLRYVYEYAKHIVNNETLYYFDFYYHPYIDDDKTDIDIFTQEIAVDSDFNNSSWHENYTLEYRVDCVEITLPLTWIPNSVTDKVTYIKNYHKKGITEMKKYACRLLDERTTIRSEQKYDIWHQGG